MAKECVTNLITNNSTNGEREEKEQVVDEQKENEWLQSKNCMSMKHMHETHGKKKGKDDNDNEMQNCQMTKNKKMKNILRC